MKYYLYGRNHDLLRSQLNARGMTETVSPDEADVIITHGGDGAMLGAEREFPGKLKFPIRDAQTAPHCPQHGLNSQLDLFCAGKLKTSFLPKLVGQVKNNRLFALNDIFIHNHKFVSALRYRVWIDDELYAKEIVGDGLGVSSVHGSTAYYRSITHSVFRTGIGLAFSNSTELVNHLVLPETSLVKVLVLRGPAELVADNDNAMIPMNAGDEALIRLSDQQTQFLGLDIFMCPVCRAIRHTTRNSTQNG